MESIVLNVRDLGQTDRSTLERVVGRQLQESQQLIIQVMTTPNSTAGADASKESLPEWCNVYAGLSPAEIDELDSAIVRSTSSREIP